MSEFSIQPIAIKNYAASYDDMERLIRECNSQLRSVVRDMDFTLYLHMAGKINRIALSNLKSLSSLSSMQSKLEEIVSLYESYDKKVAQHDINHSESANSNASAFLDYLMDALSQTLFGNFTEDSNLLGLVFSVAIGFVPVVGQLADIRDIIADIHHLIDDGPETKEWVSLGFSLLAVIPGLGDLIKHADVLKHADEVADATKGIVKNADEIVSATGKYADDFNSSMSKTYELIKKFFETEKFTFENYAEKFVEKVYVDTWKTVITEIFTSQEQYSNIGNCQISNTGFRCVA